MKSKISPAQCAFSAAFALAALAFLIAPQSRGEGGEPRYFAITHARIVPVSGPAIENGTVIIANGLIQSVGANATIPPEALVIDAKGLSVYPGLIDAGNDLGLPKPEPAPSSGQRRRRRALPATPPEHIPSGAEDRPATTPWRVAADEFNPDDKNIEAWRNAGFTTALVVPTGGIIAGQGSLLELAGDRASEMTIRANAALRLEYALQGFGFPDSLMGVISYLRQVVDDTNWSESAEKTYATHVNGLERPTIDRTEKTMSEILRRDEPILLPANDDVEIPRAVRLAGEWKLRAVLYGGQQAYAVADQIAAAKFPVIVNLKWPERGKTPDPEDERPLRVLRFQDRAPGSPAALAKAGVKFAFTSGGITETKEIFSDVRKATAAGLTSDAALRAFTLDAAEILGVADRLGSIEPGKIANLVIADGDLFAEKTKVKEVFVDGRRYQVHDVKPAQKESSGSDGDDQDDPEQGR